MNSKAIDVLFLGFRVFTTSLVLSVFSRKVLKVSTSSSATSVLRSFKLDNTSRRKATTFSSCFGGMRVAGTDFDGTGCNKTSWCEILPFILPAAPHE